MNNHFFSENAIKFAESLGYAIKDSPDLLTKCKNPDIKNYDVIETNFVNFSLNIFLGFFKIVDSFLL